MSLWMHFMDCVKDGMDGCKELLSDKKNGFRAEKWWWWLWTHFAWYLYNIYRSLRNITYRVIFSSRLLLSRQALLRLSDKPEGEGVVKKKSFNLNITNLLCVINYNYPNDVIVWYLYLLHGIETGRLLFCKQSRLSPYNYNE